MAWLATATFWDVFRGEIINNPLLVLLAMLGGSFAAGFSVRQVLRDRKIESLEADRDAARSDADRLKVKEGEAAGDAKERQSMSEHLAGWLSVPDLRATLSDHLSAWPSDRHELLVAGVIRQLLLSPGKAWLFTPTSMVFVKVSFDDSGGSRSQVSFKVTNEQDPVKALRLSLGDESMVPIMSDLAIYGFAKYKTSISKDEFLLTMLRQTPELGWTKTETSYRRVSTVRP
jgi:hypothetical protein